ncbi:MAG: hypothetical protein QF680_00220 [Acidobacteriota bacterium]|nr:hypothetical protein [Acidobacteriota bacterium]
MLNRTNIFMLYGVVMIGYGVWFLFAPVNATTLYMGEGQANMDGLSFILKWCGLFLFGLGAVYVVNRDSGGDAARQMSMAAIVVSLIAIYFSWQGADAYGPQHYSSLGLNVVWVLLHGSLLKGS